MASFRAVSIDLCVASCALNTSYFLRSPLFWLHHLIDGASLIVFLCILKLNADKLWQMLYSCDVVHIINFAGMCCAQECAQTIMSSSVVLFRLL